MIAAPWAPVNEFESRGPRRRELRCRRRVEPRARDLPLDAGRDLGGGALRALRLRAEPASARRPLGRPVADPRPRLRSPTSGRAGTASGSSASPSTATTRPAARPGLLPALPGARRPRSAACSSATTCSPGSLVSLAAALGAFVLLERLAEERLGADGARRAVLYLALFPMALFLQAVYSESLYLLLALAAFVLAERGRFGSGRAPSAGLAMLTRPTGLALLPALALLAWRSRDRRRALASLAIAPAALRRLSALLWQPTSATRGRSCARRSSGTGTSRRPARSAGSGTGSAPGWAGVEQLASGSTRTSTGRRSRGRRPAARRGAQPRGARLPRPLRRR